MSDYDPFAGPYRVRITHDTEFGWLIGSYHVQIGKGAFNVDYALCWTYGGAKRAAARMIAKDSKKRARKTGIEEVLALADEGKSWNRKFEMLLRETK